MPNAAVFTFRVEGPRADRCLAIFSLPPVADELAGSASAGLAPVWEGHVDEEADLPDLFGSIRQSLEDIHKRAGKALNLSPAGSAETVERLLLLSNDVGY